VTAGQTNAAATDPLAKMRRKLALTMLGIWVLGLGGFLSCTATLLVVFFRERTWLVIPAIIFISLAVVPIMLHLTGSSSKKVTCSGSGMSSKYKVSPSNALLNPVAILARSELAAAAALINDEDFLPPQDQPRGKSLKWIARLLKNAMFQKGDREINQDVAEAIEHYYVPVARAHFAECAEQARGMVPAMQDRCHEVRAGHLATYLDTLGQIRQETSFAELQRRSDKLVEDSGKLQRCKTQKVASICELYCGAELVSGRHETLMALVASKTSTQFHSAISPKL
jgi:hypothetical protein